MTGTLTVGGHRYDVEDLKAVSNKPAAGLIIESHMEQGRGAVARALVTEPIDQRSTEETGDHDRERTDRGG